MINAVTVWVVVGIAVISVAAVLVGRRVIELGASERDACMTFESTLAKVEGAVKSHL